MNPGEVYWYDFGEPEAGQRVMALPHMVLLLSRPERSLHGTVNACPLSSARNYAPELARSEPSVVLLRADKYGFLERDTVVLADQMFCLTPDRLRRARGEARLDKEDLDEVLGAIFDLLEMD